MKNIEFNVQWQRQGCNPQQRVTVGKQRSWHGGMWSKDQASAVLQAKQRQGCQEFHACPTNTQVAKTDL